MSNPIFVGILLFTVIAQYGLVEFGGAFVRTVRAFKCACMSLNIPSIFLRLSVYFLLDFATSLCHLFHFHPKREDRLNITPQTKRSVSWWDIGKHSLEQEEYLLCIRFDWPLKCNHINEWWMIWWQVHLDNSHWMKCVLLGAMSLPVGGLMRFIPCENSEADYADVNPLISMRAATKRYVCLWVCHAVLCRIVLFFAHLLTCSLTCSLTLLHSSLLSSFPLPLNSIFFLSSSFETVSLTCFM